MVIDTGVFGRNFDLTGIKEHDRKIVMISNLLSN